MKYHRILLIGFILCCCASYIFPSFLSNSYNSTNINPINASSTKTHSENINSINNSLTTNGKEAVNPLNVYKSEPAPMGITDFGINTNTKEPYAYNTTSFLGIAKIYSLSAGGGTSGGCVDLQLNVELKFTAGSSTYAYWLQNVAIIGTTSMHLNFLVNIWNFSSPEAILKPIGITSSYGSAYAAYYGHIDSLSYMLTYPNTIQIEIKSFLNNNEPTIAFEYKNGNGTWNAYDNVTFLPQSGPVNDMNLVVDGSQYNPYGLYYDAEFVLCGNMNWETAIDQSNTKLDLQLEYYDGQNFQFVPYSYNFGSDTGETISNIVVTGEKTSNNFYVELTHGSGSSLGPIVYKSNTLKIWLTLGIIGAVVIGVTMFLVMYLSKHRKKIEKLKKEEVRYLKS